MRKGEIACNKQFLPFSQYFLPYMILIFHFKCTLKCRLQFVSVWTGLKFCRLVMGYFGTATPFFSSPEHNLLRVSYCDRLLSGVRPCVRERLLKKSSSLKPADKFQ